MSTRDPKRRRRITVPDHMVTGHVSPNDIRAYLRTSGWNIAADVPTYFERGKGIKRQLQRSPPDDASPRELVNIIHDIAWSEQRSMGEVLRDIETLAGTPSMKTALTDKDLSEIAESIPTLRDLPGIRPWNVKLLARAVASLGLHVQGKGDLIRIADLSGAIRVLVEVDRRIAATLRRH